ncbi:helix-turn-helix transcriptional regulator [Mesorhizobium sp. LSJC264A00]|uniref:helix-turn-helix domain-containing protein n=1 Tax=unclassified Mesorhizobium TaxID=325217 RepID=UPI0003CF3365|nr:helix-turn-helix transcriptional regulator [Mesorhizobium sp. LSJC264A00]ESX19121.1 hypothetical protein X767_23255 [Mesorhizobium sp. LSJC264A00]
MTPEQFKAWRKDLGLSQEAAAAVLGVSRGSIENYERGSRREDQRPVEIPTNVVRLAVLIAYRKDINARIEVLERQVELLETGHLKTRESTIEHPEWRDTTQTDIEHAQEHIRMYQGILSRLDVTA